MDFVEMVDYYHVPRQCEKCGGVMVFVGVGEYHCEDCEHVQYDDYGKVRMHIEKNPGATAYDVEMATGVKQRTIRQMLKENRLEIADSSKVMLFCEYCKKPIKSGRLCVECEKRLHRKLESEQRQRIVHNMAGIATNHGGEQGQRRFVRDK